MLNKLIIIVAGQFLAQNVLGQCTFDPPNSPPEIAGSPSSDYYHLLRQGYAWSDDYLSASVTSNNGCDQSSLLRYVDSLQLVWPHVQFCHIHKWNGSSYSTQSLTTVAAKVNWYESGCTNNYNYVFTVLSITDSTGNVLWSNYMLLMQYDYSGTHAENLDVVSSQK